MSFTNFITQLGAAGAGGLSYWIASFNVSSTGVPWVSTVREFSNGEILITGNLALTGSGAEPFAARLSSTDGSIIWSKRLRGPVAAAYKIENAQLTGSHIDSSDNVYLQFSDYNGSYAGFMSLNSNGTTRWSGNAYWYNKSRTLASCLLGNDADIYSIGSTTGIQSGYRGLITQWDTSNGDFQADRALTGITNYAYGGDINGSTIIMTGYGNYFAYSHATVKQTVANSLSTSGSETGIRYSSANVRGRDVAIDSSGNVYVVCSVLTGNSPWAIYKLNSSLNSISWQKYYEPAGTTNASNVGHPSLQISSDNRLFVMNSYEVGSDKRNLVAEINTSNGNVIWANGLGVSGKTYLPCSVNGYTFKFLIHSDESVIYPVFDLNGVFHLLKVPMDGSLMGTYGNYSYSSVSIGYNTGISASLIPDYVGWSTSGDDQTGFDSTQNTTYSISQTDIETL